MGRIDVESDAVSLAALFEVVSEIDDDDFKARAVALSPRLGEVFRSFILLRPQHPLSPSSLGFSWLRFACPEIA